MQGKLIHTRYLQYYSPIASLFPSFCAVTSSTSGFAPTQRLQPLLAFLLLPQLLHPH